MAFPLGEVPMKEQGIGDIDRNFFTITDNPCLYYLPWKSWHHTQHLIWWWCLPNRVLWVSKPWVCTLPTSMSGWTPSPTYSSTLRSLLSPPDPWNTFASESCQQVTVLIGDTSEVEAIRIICKITSYNLNTLERGCQGITTFRIDVFYFSLIMTLWSSS